MASSSCVLSDQESEVLSSQAPAMGGSGGAETLPAPGTEIVQASASTPPALSGAEKPPPLTVAEQIQQSQRHWSELSVSTSTPDSKKPFEFFRNLAARIRGRHSDADKAVEIDNRKVFKELQSHPSWGHFFKTFGYTLRASYPGKPGFIIRSAGSMRVGEKFAEGAQAELFHVHITFENESDRKLTEMVEVHGSEWVLKVFKKGTLLRHLQSQWPLGFLQFKGEEGEKWKCPHYQGLSLAFFSSLICGTLLEDGRFAFVMRREIEDLRSFIDRNVISRTNQDCGPFSKDFSEGIMWMIAKGMDWFHSRNIVHRDLKASNVLVGKGRGGKGMTLYIDDYECSIGVVGTKFFRAPKILQACMDRSISLKPELFTKAVDVYSFGMTCYEVLTGRFPFEGHPQSDYHHVLNGHPPELPPYVDGWICDLLKRCWDANPTERPPFEEISNIIVANSMAAKEFENLCQESLE